MGQYLAIGIAWRVTATDEEARPPLGEVAVRRVVERLLPRLDIFAPPSPSEDGRRHEYLLSQQVFQDGLLALLESIYPKLGSADDAAEHTRMIEQLRATPSEHWIEAIRNHELSAACLHWERPFPDYLRADVPFKWRVRLDFDMITLFSEGRVLAECAHDSFRFFQHCIHRAFAGHELAKALRVYIAG